MEQNMSHYCTMDVIFKVEFEQDLVEVLEAQFGKGHIEVHEEPKPLFGFQGDNRALANKNGPDYAPPCDIIIRREYVGRASNDIGFKRMQDGTFKAYVSEFDSYSNYPKKKQEQTAKEYSLRVTEKTLRSDGWRNFVKTTDKDGTVHLKVSDKQQLVAKNW
jgi:hypothetical protein